MKRLTGVYHDCSTAGETYRVYVPNPLPPAPPLELDTEHHDLTEKANRAFGSHFTGQEMLLDPTTGVRLQAEAADSFVLHVQHSMASC